MEIEVNQSSNESTNSVSKIIREHPTLSFFLITYILSWSFWIPIVYLVNKYGEDEIVNEINLGLLIILFIGLYIGLFGPALSAIIVTRIISGKSGRKEFFRRIFKWKVGWQWYMMVILLSVSIFFISNLGLVVLGGSIARPLNNYSFLSLIFLFLDYFLLHGGQEELGWRGFAQSKLQKKYSSFNATLILGVLWAFWHLPLFFLEGGQYSQDNNPFLHFVLFVLGACTLSFFLTIIYNHTQSTFLAMLFHAFVNSFQKILRPEEITTSIDYHDLTHYVGAGIFAFLIGVYIITNESNKLHQLVFPRFPEHRSIDMLE